MASYNLPTRTMTNSDDGEAIPDENNSEVTNLFLQRLQAWKHACVYLEDYVSSTEKMQHAHGKEYEKVLKTVNQPLKEGDQFDGAPGGINSMFESIKTNTQAISNSHTETAKSLKASVLPMFERLHSELKTKNKELAKGAGKQSKAVDKARQTTQKHIELLGQHTAGSSTASKLAAHEDPYILHRQVYYHLNNQVIEENSNRKDLLVVQDSFASFEAHVIQTFQNGLAQFNQIVGNQAAQTQTLYGNMVGNAQRIAPDFEWRGFLSRNGNTLIDPSHTPRKVENISFANQNHKSTVALITGSLDRKGTLLKKYDTGYYAVTPSGYLHEFKSDDDKTTEPKPETSLYLPDCLIGALDGVKFQLKGKDFSAKLARSHDYAFKAHSPQDAQRWYDAITRVAGGNTNEKPDTSAPSSPVGSRNTSANYGDTPAQGFTAGQTAAYPVSQTTYDHASSPVGQATYPAGQTAAYPVSQTTYNHAASPVGQSTYPAGQTAAYPMSQTTAYPTTQSGYQGTTLTQDAERQAAGAHYKS